MGKIFIVGISGTGKSWVGVRLAERTGLTLHHMDSIIWSTDWAETPEDRIGAALAKISAAENWIVEGWIDVYSKDLLQRSDIILYLDYPGWLAVWGAVCRWLKYRGSKRPEMPEGCEESLDVGFLRTLMLRKERPHIEAMLEGIPPKNIVRVRSRRHAEKVLCELVLKARTSG
jgi:adenylate kinase family enzyme